MSTDLKVITVDSTGNADEMTLETFLELLVPMLPTPVAPTPEPTPVEPAPVLPGAVEKMDFRKLAAEHTLDLDAFSQHFVNASAPTALIFVTKAAYDDVVSAQVEIMGDALVTFPEGVRWHTPPRTKGGGILTVRRSTYRGKDVWRLFWSPEVA